MLVKFRYISFLLLCILPIAKLAAQETIFKMSAIPAIDGIPDQVWNSRNWINIEKTTYFPKPASNFSGRFKTGWYSDSMYLFFEITDDSIIPGDKLIIYFDFGREKKTNIYEDDKNDFALTFYPGNDLVTITRPVEKLFSLPLLKSVKKAWKVERSKGFYTFEAAICLYDFGLPVVKPLSEIGFNTEIIDIDKLNSNSTSLFWNFNSSFLPMRYLDLSCTYHYGYMTFSNDDNPLIISFLKTDVKSTGKYSGSIDITVSNGVPPYTYSWSNGLKTEDIFKLDSGKYTVIVTDVEGRKAVETIEIFDYRPNIIAACKQSSLGPIIDGTVDDIWKIANYNPVKTPDNQIKAKFKTLWNNGTVYLLIEITDTTITNNDKLKLYFDWGNERMPGELDENDYCMFFSLKDTNEFRAITNKGAIEHREELPSFIKAQRTDNTKGISTFEFAFKFEAWSKLSITAPDLQIGFDLKLIDFNGTNSTETFWNKLDSSSTIDPALWGGIAFFEGLTVKADITHVSKVGGSDGKIEITVNGGYQPYTYLWGNGDTTKSISGLFAGEYLLTVTDSYGISASFILTVGTSGPRKGDCSISGTVLADSLTENDACVLLYFLIDKYYKPIDYFITRNDGKYFFENLSPGEYIIYAIPNKENKNHLPTYFVNNLTWDSCHPIIVKGKASLVDINLAINSGEITKTVGEISGVVVYNDTNCYEKSFMEKIVLDNIPADYKGISKPASNIPVFISDGNKIVAWDISDRNGVFKINGLPGKKYFITAQKPSLIVSNNLELELTNNNPLIDDITVSLGDYKIITSRAAKELQIIVYPQPSTSEITLDFQNFALADFSVSIYSIQGKLFKKLFIKGELNSTYLKLNISDIPDNMYIGEVRSANYKGKFRFVKQK